jgi:hypothetical protein
MLLRLGQSVRRFSQGCFLAKARPRASRRCVRRRKGGPRARRKSLGVGCPCPRLGSGEAWSSHSYGLIPDLIAPIRPLQLYADGGFQLRIRRLEGTPNYGPRQVAFGWFKYILRGVWNLSKVFIYRKSIFRKIYHFVPSLSSFGLRNLEIDLMNMWTINSAN